MIFEKVKDFVKDRIISAGISWLIGLLNPAGAFIKACKLIYDIVMFFVNNRERIKKFVDTVLDSVSDIVRGNIGGVVNKINDMLGQMVPIIIGFLASLIGLGDIGKKIREIVEKLQKPVNQAIDFVIKTGLKLVGPSHPWHSRHRRQGEGQGRRWQGLGEGEGRGRQGVGQRKARGCRGSSGPRAARSTARSHLPRAIHRGRRAT